MDAWNNQPAVCHARGVQSLRDATISASILLFTSLHIYIVNIHRYSRPSSHLLTNLQACDRPLYILLPHLEPRRADEDLVEISE